METPNQRLLRGQKRKIKFCVVSFFFQQICIMEENNNFKERNIESENEKIWSEENFVQNKIMDLPFEAVTIKMTPNLNNLLPFTPSIL